MKKYMMAMQTNLKKSSNSLFMFTVRSFTGLFIGFTLALVGQELFKYGTFLFAFVIMATVSVILVISRHWSIWVIGTFNLFCILLGLLLRMYAFVAPGA